MNYELSIGTEGNVVKITNSEIIKKINFTIAQNDKTSSERSERLFNTISIFGKLNDNSQEETLKLLNWSLKTSKKDVYQPITIKVVDNGDKLREYYLEDVFCSNYSENFSNSDGSEGSEDEGTFLLELKQRVGSDYLKTIKVDCKD